MRSPLQQCASAVSSAQPVKQKSAPHPRLPPHLLPVATGRRDQHAFSRTCSLHLCDDASRPFAPRSGEKVVRQHRMRGRGRWGAFAMQPCTSADSSAAAVMKHESAPHPRLPPHLLPVATGRRDRHAFSPECSLDSCDDASRPFAPRSGEKVVRQHRMRGRGRWGAFDVAVVRESNSIGVAEEQARKRPSSAAAAAPSPRRNGEKGPACAFIKVQQHILATAPAFLRPAPAGRRWCGSTG